MSAIRRLATATLAVLAAAPATAQDQGAALPPTDPMPALQWVPAANGAVPLQALAGGVEDGRTIYLCRAGAEAGTVKVGTLRSGGGCEVPMGTDGTATRPRYEVLTGAPWVVTWDRAAGPRGGDVVVGGQWQGRPAPLCQIDHFGGVHSGMVVGDRCMVAAGGKTLMAQDFRFATANPGGQFAMRWASQGWTPQGALTASGDAAGAPICLAQQGGGWWPGTLRGGLCTAAAPSGARPLASVTYQTIVADPGRVVWAPFRDGRQPTFLPQDTIAIGGQSPGGAVPVCRATIDGRMLSGYVAADTCAVVTADGAARTASDYEVLLYRQTPQTARR